MRIEQEKIPSTEALAEKYDFSRQWDDEINYEEVYKFAKNYNQMFINRIKYEYNQYQFFLEGYRNGSASISEVTVAHDRFLKLLEI